MPAEHDNLAPEFLPNSDRVLFLRSNTFEHYSPLVDNRRHKFDLYSVSTQDKRVVELTHERFYDINKLSVAPNGRRVLLSTTLHPQGDIFRVLPVNDPKGKVEDLQPKVPNAPNGGPVLYEASWLPDSRGIIFKAASQNPTSSNFDYNLYRLNKNGQIEKLTTLTGIIDDYCAAPDGSKIVFLKDATFHLLDLASRQVSTFKAAH